MDFNVINFDILMALKSEQPVCQISVYCNAYFWL